jgi:SAM-dependent methyltransferase
VSSRDVQQAYSSLAQLYIDLLGSVESVHPDDLLLIERHLGHLEGPVLDVGCGPGHLTGFLRSAGRDVTGIDLVPEFIAHARQTYPEARFEVGSLADLARPDASVAGVLAWYSLIHVDPAQMDGVLTAIRRVVAPGGALVMGFFRGPVREPFEHKVITAYRWPTDEVAGRLASAGFVEVERSEREREGDRRPHAVIAARAV